MPLNPDAFGLTSGPNRRSWDHRDCLLYALGVGAGSDDPYRELEFTTENSTGVVQRVLPTMAVVLGARPRPSLWEQVGSFEAAMVVHGEQAITLHREIPVEGELETVSEITGVYDKGSGAVIVTEATSTLVATAEPLFTTRSAQFVRGEGGWGGDRGPSGATNQAPDRKPDAEVTYRTRTDQALLYRLSGDRNPLHSDPAVAAKGGFERPILHGLCTYGFTGRALLHARCDGNPARFHAMTGRFSSPVLPGEALTVQIWDEGDGSAIFRTLGDDGRTVLDAGRLDHG